MWLVSNVYAGSEYITILSTIAQIKFTDMMRRVFRFQISWPIAYCLLPIAY